MKPSPYATAYWLAAVPRLCANLTLPERIFLDFSDIEGLTRLVRQAVETINAMDIPGSGKLAWIVVIEQQHRSAMAACEDPPSGAPSRHLGESGPPL